MEELSRSVDQFNPFGDQHDAFASALFAESHQLAWDAEGRIMLPDRLRAAAGIADLATFVGRGATFQIWEPEAAQANQEAARQRARDEREALRLPGRGGGDEG
jgi:MraZ protein